MTAGQGPDYYRSAQRRALIQHRVALVPAVPLIIALWLVGPAALGAGARDAGTVFTFVAVLVAFWVDFGVVFHTTAVLGWASRRLAIAEARQREIDKMHAAAARQLEVWRAGRAHRPSTPPWEVAA